jgi:EmrB/QacA subfamily drug resistance transporter
MGIGLSNSSTMVIIGRAIQGIGAAIIMPSSLSMINASFTGRSRTTAFAVWGGTIGGMAALGPLVGGWMTTYHSWHWAFFANLPVSILVIVGVLRTMPESRDPDASRTADRPGIALSTLGLAGLVFALIEGQRLGWLRSITRLDFGPFTLPVGTVALPLVAASAGVICVIAFVVVERRRQAAGLPLLLDLRLFAIPSFRAGTIVALIVSLGEFGLLFVLPLFVQGALGYDPMQTGVLLLALAVGSFLASGAGAGMAHRMGAIRVLQIGMALEAIGIATIGLSLSVDATRASLAPSLFVYGLGIGFATAQLTGVILRDVPLEQSGQASAVQSTARQVGAAIGTAILGASLAVATSASVTSNLLAQGVGAARANEIATFVTDTAGQLIQFLILQPNGQMLVDQAHAGFASATRWVALIATGFVLLGLSASFRLPEQARRSDET